MSQDVQISTNFVYPTPNVAQIKWDAATNTITPDNTLPPWVFTSKLVAKPDQLIKRRGKSGLLLLNKEWAEAKEWISARAGKPTQVRLYFLLKSWFPLSPQSARSHRSWFTRQRRDILQSGTHNQIVQALLIPRVFSLFPFSFSLVSSSRCVLLQSRSNQSRVLSTHSSSSPSFHTLPTLNSTSASTRLARVTRFSSPTRVVSM